MCIQGIAAALSAASVFDYGPLQVSPNGRYLMHQSGRPFFYLGDTGWLLFMALDRVKVESYLTNRASSGYTVVMGSLWAFRDANAYGDPVFDGGDQTRPNAAYFAHVDWIIDKAADNGLYVAVNPAWGNTGLGGKSGAFSQSEARAFGEFLGARFKDKPNVIWFLGGDCNENKTANEAFRAGIRAAGDTHLITWHPDGGTSSIMVYPNTNPIIDFNMVQTGHYSRNIQPTLARDAWNASPPKPFLNAEPNYEDHAVGWDSNNGYFDELDVRKQAYWSVFSGACGHVYGHHAIWQFYEGSLASSFFEPPLNNIYWTNAMNRPGSAQMHHLRRLVESRPVAARIPDQSLIVSGNGTAGSLIAATRDSQSTYAMVYVPLSGHAFGIDMTKLSGPDITAWWYNPRTGQAAGAGTCAASGTRQFTTPPNGPDWVLVLDDAKANYPAPGLAQTSHRAPAKMTPQQQAPRVPRRVVECRTARCDPHAAGMMDRYTINGQKRGIPREHAAGRH